MIQNKKGFSVPIVLVVIVMLVVVVFVGYKVISANKPPTTPTADEAKNTNKTEVIKASDTSSKDAANSMPKAPETPASSSDAQPDTTTRYDASATNGKITFEIRPKSQATGKNVEYRLSGELLELGDQVDIMLIDSAGNYRNIAGLIMTSNNTRELFVTIPAEVYDCKFGASCPYKLVPTAKGLGKLMITHGPSNIVDVSIPFEVL
jgi:hypothetical protein